MRYRFAIVSLGMMVYMLSSFVALAQGPNGSTVTLVSSENPAYVGQAVVFTATVAAAVASAGTPTGTVTFFNGATQLGAVNLVNGVAPTPPLELGQGSNSISAQYGGDANFAPSSASLTRVINPDPPLILTSITISIEGGPSWALVGGYIQFYAFGSYCNVLGCGPSQNITNIATWTSSDPTVAVPSVTSGGGILTVGPGTALVTASYDGVTSNSVAIQVPQPTVRFLGGGSMFVELGRAAQSSSSTGTPCVWTYPETSEIVASDPRFNPTSNEQGEIWVTWGPGAGTCAAPAGAFDVYAYMSLDSGIGNKCFFAVDSSGTSGCIQIFQLASGVTGMNLLCSPSPSNCSSFGPDTPIPGAVSNALQNQRFFALGTDIRPEDAEFAVKRMLSACDQYMPRQYFNNDSYYLFGLGFQTSNPNVGVPVLGLLGGSVNVVNFNAVGNDPVSGWAVPSFTAFTVGARPIVVAVSPATDESGIAAATDIPAYTLASFFQGTLARTTDLVGPTVTEPVDILIPDPLSGVYNTFEYSIPQGTQFHASQDDEWNCIAGTVWHNPMDNPNGNGVFGQQSIRYRVYDETQMLQALQQSLPSAAGHDYIGYFFYSAYNAAGLNNVRYLKVNGVDPLLPPGQYNGVIPGSGAPGDPGLSAVTFDGVNSGDYPIWSVLRIVSLNPVPAGVSNMVTAMANFPQPDYIPAVNLNVWHSHFFINGIEMIAQPSNGPTINPATPNDLCDLAGGASPESGGDAGGSTMLKQNNAHFCADFNSQTGVLNKTQ